MSGAAAAAPAAGRRKKTNKILQPAQQPPDAGERASGAPTPTPAPATASDPHDEVPIGKKGPASFEELLARELAREQGGQQAQVQQPASKSASKATFLKRGSGSVAALAKSKTNDGDRRVSLGEGAGESRSREPLAETSRTNKSTPDVLVQGHASGNVWDDIPVGKGKVGAHNSQPKKDEVRSVARKLVVEDAGAPRAAQVSRTAEQQPAARASRETLCAPAPSHGRGAQSLRGARMRQLQQLNPEEEAELLEFESLERKVVQAGADDSIYRNVLKQDAYAGDSAADSDYESDALGEHQNALEHEQSEPFMHPASEDLYMCEEAETWDDADSESAAALQDLVHPCESQHRADEEDNGGAYEAPARSSLVNKLFVQKQPKRKTATPTAKSGPARGKEARASKDGTAAPAAKENEGGHADDAALENKMAQLDEEIREFRKQNALLDKLRQELDAEREEVALQRRSLSENLVEAEQRFERYKEAELKKLKRDRRDMDKQLQLAQAQVGDLRGERDSMRQEMQVLQEDAARREKKLKSEVDRLKKKLEDMQLRNEELVRELRFSEEARVAMQDKEHLATLKARATAKQDALAVPPAAPLGMSPRSQDVLAAQIATSAVESHQTHSLAGREALCTSGVVASGSKRDSGDSSTVVGSGNLLCRTLDASAGESKHSEGLSKLHDDSMTASLYVDRTGLITDETLEIDVATMRKMPVRNSSARELQHSKTDPGSAGSESCSTIVSEKQHGDGKVERVFADGKKLLIFSNGTRKEVFPGGGSVVHFSNKDVKHTFPDGKVVYFYSETRTTHTTQPDGLEMFEFSNGQREKHLPDGSKEILFPDGTLKNIRANKEEESIFPDGTVQRIFIDGTRVIEFTNGLKETISPNGNKVRTFKTGGD